jgi:hypothetical protein
MATFKSNYPGSFWNGNNPLAKFSGQTYSNSVTCTTCHDQHSESRYGTYTTMFFVKGNYNPISGGNSVAQFCRNCHGGESNEMHGLAGVATN